MPLVKSKKNVEFTVKVPSSLFEEMERYSSWADVSMEDIVSHAVKMLFEQDQHWVEEKTPGASMTKTGFVREVYAEIVSGKHSDINEKIGKVSAGSAFKVISEVRKRDDIAYGTCTAQVSYCNKLAQTQGKQSDKEAHDWKVLSAKIAELGGKLP